MGPDLAAPHYRLGGAVFFFGFLEVHWVVLGEVEHFGGGVGGELFDRAEVSFHRPGADTGFFEGTASGVELAPDLLEDAAELTELVFHGAEDLPHFAGTLLDG